MHNASFEWSIDVSLITYNEYPDCRVSLIIPQE